MNLRGKRALVTGSSRGIGRAIALRLAQGGADVAIHYHSSREGADEALREIRALGRAAEAFSADLSKTADAISLVERASAEFGELDILVNNAGYEKNAPFWDVTEEDYDAVVNLNLKSVFFATQAFVRGLRAHGRRGKVINISSVHEDLPFPNFAAYCAAKGGIRMLTRNLAVELGPLGITVNGVAPGAIRTAMNDTVLKDDEKKQKLLDQIPLGRIGEVGDVAAVVAFLASPEADYVTGSTYFVDGGLSHNYHEQ